MKTYPFVVTHTLDGFSIRKVALDILYAAPCTYLALRTGLDRRLGNIIQNAFLLPA